MRFDYNLNLKYFFKKTNFNLIRDTQFLSYPSTENVYYIQLLKMGKTIIPFIIEIFENIIQNWDDDRNFTWDHFLLIDDIMKNEKFNYKSPIKDRSRGYLNLTLKDYINWYNKNKEKMGL